MVNVELKIINECHSDWIPTFLSEEIEESFSISTINSKDTSASVGMTKIEK